MSDMTLVVVIAGAVVVLVLVALAIASARRKARRERLQERFGPEYDRVVGGADGRKERHRAVDELAGRAEQRDRLDIKPLPPGARERYATQWREIQTRFVDTPDTALDEAEALLDEVLRTRGYPVEDFDEQAALVSVDHPDLVESYRNAHATRDRVRAGDGSTEDMRHAVLQYRSLLDELLAPEAPARAS